jgi:hypoxanthine phosphoribosyltransferase
VTGIPKYEAPTWSQIYTLLLNLSREICGSGFKLDIIVGVSRGGWLPARVLSDLLENSNLANVKTECYIGIAESRDQPKLTQCVSVDVAGKKVLVVDEIADSGKSLQLVVAHLLAQGAAVVKTATLCSKPKSAFIPDFCPKQTDCWVIFPWEIKETVHAIYESHKTTPEQAEKEFAALQEAGVSKRLITRFLSEFSEAKTC